MKSNLSPETLELLARERDAAQELPFDAEALLAEVNAQMAGGATPLAPKAASSTVRPPTSGWYSKFALFKVGLAALGVGGLFLALRASQPTPGAPRGARATAAATSPEAPPRAAAVPSVVPRSTPAPAAVLPAAERPVADTFAAIPAPVAGRRPVPRAVVLAAPAHRPPAPVAAPPADAEVTASAAPPPTVPAIPSAAPPADPFAVELALLDRAERALSAGQARDALDLLADLLERNASGQLVPEAMAAQVRAHCALHDAAAATAVALRLIARAPHSVSARRVRGSCVSDQLPAAP